MAKPNPMTLLAVVMFFLPWSIFIAGTQLNPGSDAGRCVKWRPDPWMYITAWSVIALLLGISGALVALTKMKSTPRFVVQMLLYVAVVALCIIWMWRYREDQGPDGVVTGTSAISVFIMLISAGLALLLLTWRKNPGAAACLAPLIVWAVFQLFVSTKEIDVGWCPRPDPTGTVTDMGT